MPCHMKRNCLQKHVAISRGGKGEQHVLFSLITMRHLKAEIQFNDYRREKLISKTVGINEGTYIYIYICRICVPISSRHVYYIETILTTIEPYER